MIPINTTSIPLEIASVSDDCRPLAFGIYQKLLSLHRGDSLFLLESLGQNSIDSRTSIIGINPLISLQVRDREISIDAPSFLIESISTSLQDVGIFRKRQYSERLIYSLARRETVWDFLRAFETIFVESPRSIEGIFAFVALGYNTVYYMENINGYSCKPNDIADISIIFYQSIIIINQRSAELRTYSTPGIAPADSSTLKRIVESVKDIEDSGLDDKQKKFSIKAETKKTSYVAKATQALHHVEIGDVYQVQIGHKISVKCDISPIETYAHLRKLNPSPYMYLFTLQGHTVVGASPELFIRISDNKVLMRPIAGTLGKAPNITIADAAKQLHSNEKEVAEHMMLVDLCRNDLCRVCTPSSVNVTGLMEIEEYSHVFHMVSSTSATLKPEFDKYDAIKASFPAGTMTGTPKIRAIELIAELEESTRDLYAGALGIIGFGTNFINTALCIRTAVETNGEYAIRASAGIVSDSNSGSEYAETIHKMSSMFRAITGEELKCHIE